MSYVAPSGLVWRESPVFVGFHPTLIYVAPSGLVWRESPVFVGFHPTLIYVAPSGLAIRFMSFLRGLHLGTELFNNKNLLYNPHKIFAKNRLRNYFVCFATLPDKSG